MVLSLLLQISQSCLLFYQEHISKKIHLSLRIIVLGSTTTSLRVERIELVSH